MRITRSIVPNLFTLVNLYAGYSAIVYISMGEYGRAGLFILIAGIFDVLDGAVARLLKSTSEFGIELDSLCDAVSFGVAPSYLLYKVHFYQFGDIGILISSLPALAGVVRLARFNIKQATLDDKKYFIGLPIPSNAILLVTFVLYFFLGNEISNSIKNFSIIAITIISSLAMVSNIKFDNLPRPSINYLKSNPIKSIFFLLLIPGTIIFEGKFIFLFVLFYVLFSAIRHLANLIIENRNLADEIDESEEPEPGPFDL